MFISIVDKIIIDKEYFVYEMNYLKNNVRFWYIFKIRDKYYLIVKFGYYKIEIIIY